MRLMGLFEDQESWKAQGGGSLGGNQTPSRTGRSGTEEPLSTNPLPSYLKHAFPQGTRMRSPGGK